MKLLYTIPAFALLTLSSCSKPAAPEEKAAKPVVTVQTAKAETHDLTIYVSAPATIFPRNQANVTARMTAPIQSIHVRKGQLVKEGQSIATLDHRDLDAQRADAQAQLADAQATLEKTQSGTVPADLDAKRGAVQIAQSALNQTKLTLDRRTQLFNEGAIPQRDLLQAQTDFNQAQTTYDVAKRAYDLAQTQTSERDIRSAQARVASAKAKLELAETQLQFTDIRAPFTGTLSDQFVFAGDLADITKPLFQLMDLAVVNARAQVPEQDAPRVHQGQGCTFVPVDTSLGTFNGTVTVINQAVDAQRRTVEVWCEINNPSGKLNGNVFGEVRVLVRQVAKAITVPISALEIQQGQTTGTVLVVDDKNIAHRREVEPGERSGDRIEIRKGVTPGETVVTKGGYALPDGTSIELEKTASEKEEDKGKEAKDDDKK